MGVGRVTQGMMVQRTLSNLNMHLRELFKLQDQLATGLRVNRPSDDPIAARRAVNTRVNLQKNEQYIRNIQSVGPHLTETASSIQSSVSMLQRTLELALQGATGTVSQTQLDALAQEMDELLEGVLDRANHRTSGRYIFGGTRTLSPPFVATRNADDMITAVAYEGNTSRTEIAVSDDATVHINEPGPSVFQADVDIFDMLIGLRDALLTGDQNQIRDILLGDVHTGIEQLLLAEARIGAVQNQLERATFDMEDFNVQLESLISDSIDADYTETIVNLNSRSNAFQAALSAGARVITPSLLDFIR